LDKEYVKNANEILFLHNIILTVFKYSYRLL